MMTPNVVLSFYDVLKTHIGSDIRTNKMADMLTAISNIEMMNSLQVWQALTHFASRDRRAREVRSNTRVRVALHKSGNARCCVWAKFNLSPKDKLTICQSGKAEPYW